MLHYLQILKSMVRSKGSVCPDTGQVLVLVQAHLVWNSFLLHALMTISPENGFWVIGLADGEEYWAHTDPWTRLTVSGKPEKIGIFLNISANKLSFYNAKKKTALYTFTSIGGSKQERKFIPFFSTGSGVSVHDTEPLKIVQEFDDDD